MPSAPFRPEPFTSSTGPAELDDLRRRLRQTRWPRTPADAGWAEGTDLAALRTLVEYWADSFDWAAVEARLNELPRYRATLDASRGAGTGTGGGVGTGTGTGGGTGTGTGTIGVHYVHVRAASGAHPLPLILTHGWPDSFWRYSKVIGLLTDPAAHGGDPEDAFDVIVPDMPGFGYSDQPFEALDSRDVAALWAQLMTGLGYERFVAAGGDIGSHVSRYLALDEPSRVIAVHRTDAGLPFPALDPAALSEPEREWLAGAAGWAASEGAYAAMHRSKPLTAAVGLSDSPAASPPGSSRSCTRGARLISSRTTSSRTSRSTGSPARSARRCGCIAPTPPCRRSSSPAGSRCRRASACSRPTSCGRRASGSTVRRTRSRSPTRPTAATSHRSSTRPATPTSSAPSSAPTADPR
nr:epoxide hydrolase [Herbiconiux sp. VKM Ac-1786]